MRLSCGIYFGLFAGLYFGLVGGVIAWLVGKLGVFLHHLFLRFWLWQSQVFPFYPIPFLNDACARHLLKRIGGSYQFMHRLLLEYFADLYPPK